MLINVFGEWIKSDLIKKIVHGDASGWCSTHYTPETGCSVILTTTHIDTRYDIGLDGKERKRTYEINDYVRFSHETYDEVAQEINKKIKECNNDVTGDEQVKNG